MKVPPGPAATDPRTGVSSLVADLQALAAAMDPDAITDEDVLDVLRGLAQASRLVDGLVTVLARRVEEARVHRRTGHRSAAVLLADTMGTGTGTARRRLRTSRQLTDQPRVRAAMAGGWLSTEQATLVSDAATVAPDATEELLDAAASQDLPGLRTTAQRIRRDADPDPGATRRRHWLDRSFRSWTDAEGRWNAAMNGPADLGARIEAALRAEHDAIFAAAHKDGRREEDASYRFDALLGLVEAGAETMPEGADAAGTPKADREPADPPPDPATNPAAPEPPAEGSTGPSSPDPDDPPHRDGRPDQGDQSAPHHPADRAEGHAAQRPDRSGPPPRRRRRSRRSGRQTSVVIRVDAAALRRGSLAEGEVCEIAGIGPVSLEAVRAQIPDAHIAYVLADATDVSVAHLGRQPTARQRTALQARGYRCEVPGCSATHLLEIDHVTGWAITRTTRLDDLAWICQNHHSLKTDRGYRLCGPPSDRRWLAPDGRLLAGRPVRPPP